MKLCNVQNFNCENKLTVEQDILIQLIVDTKAIYHRNKILIQMTFY